MGGVRGEMKFSESECLRWVLLSSELWGVAGTTKEESLRESLEFSDKEEVELENALVVVEVCNDESETY